MHPLELDAAPPVRAHNAGLFVSRGEGTHPERVIDSHELIFVRDGLLKLREEESRFAVAAGQSLILWPGRWHGGLEPYPPDLSFYWIHFAADGCSDRSTDLSLSVPQHTTVTRPDHLAELFRRFLDDQKAGSQSDVSASLLLMLMLCEVSGSNIAIGSPHDNAAVLAGRADTYIRTHFHAPLSASSVAGELGCNPDYLGRAFRSVYGRTLTEAIHTRRLRHARRMLLESDRNVNEVARACGFTDVRYFRRVFKRHEAMTPLAFRRLYAQLHVNTE